jgi:hypothetical protein
MSTTQLIEKNYIIYKNKNIKLKRGLIQSTLHSNLSFTENKILSKKNCAQRISYIPISIKQYGINFMQMIYHFQ